MRVAIADDHRLMLDGIKRALETAPDIEVVGEAGDGVTAVELAAELRPDVVLMDVSMPAMDGIEATYALKARVPELTVLMLSIGDKDQEIAASRAGGASEFLVKGSSGSTIVAAIKRHGAVAALSRR